MRRFDSDPRLQKSTLPRKMEISSSNKKSNFTRYSDRVYSSSYPGDFKGKEGKVRQVECDKKKFEEDPEIKKFFEENPPDENILLKEVSRRLTV